MELLCAQVTALQIKLEVEEMGREGLREGLNRQDRRRRRQIAAVEERLQWLEEKLLTFEQRQQQQGALPDYLRDGVSASFEEEREREQERARLEQEWY